MTDNPEKVSTQQRQERITQLDGLRGLAIILVIINHLRWEPLFNLTARFWHPWLNMLNNNGRIGVSILFLLSGYLMSTLYGQIPDRVAFWQKRYTRIFPAFIAMCVAMTILRWQWEHLSWLMMVAIVMAVVWFGGRCWRWLQAQPSRRFLGRILFFGFVLLQLVTIGGYVLLQAKVPPAIFYQIWSDTIRYPLYLLINATMTLPFGQYVPQLDGAYWSVLTEMFFYLLFPVVILPLMRLTTVKGAWWQQAWIIGGWALAGIGFSYLSERIWGTSMLQLYLIIYFIIGTWIGLAQRASWFLKVKNNMAKLPGWLGVVLALTFLLSSPLIGKLSIVPHTIELALWSLPVLLVFIYTMSQNTLWVRILRHPWLVRIGELSFSLYLTHTIAIEMFVKQGPPTTVSQMLMAAVPALAVMSVLAFWLNHYLEKPYFNHGTTSQQTPLPSQLGVFMKLRTVKIPGELVGVGVFGVLLFLVWMGYRTPAPIWSIVDSIDGSGYVQPLSIKPEPIVLPFTAKYSGLGMLYLDLVLLSNSQVEAAGLVRGSNDTAQLVVRIEKNGQNIVNNQYYLGHLHNNPFHPVGLPLQQDSIGQNYQVALYTSVADTMQLVALQNQDVILRAVYFVTPQQLLTEPTLLMTWIQSKVWQPFLEKDAQLVLLSLVPLCAGAIFLRYYSGSSINKQRVLS